MTPMVEMRSKVDEMIRTLHPRSLAGPGVQNMNLTLGWYQRGQIPVEYRWNLYNNLLLLWFLRD